MARSLPFIIVFLLLLGCSGVFGQEKFRVYYTDKKNTDFDPYTYFDLKAIERRINQGLPLFDESDLPVNEDYIFRVSSIADSMGFSSRWFNFSVVYTSSEQQIAMISQLPFVRYIEKAPVIPAFICSESNEIIDYNDAEEYLNSGRQINRMGANLFRARGIDGRGIRIAIFDAGFPQVNTHPAFEAIRKEGRIIKTWDFVRNKENVYYGNAHGRMTFACVAGTFKNQDIGLATGAEFLLAKTEVNGEYLFEEENWLAAAEWADKNGAHIISSSLGYGDHRYYTWNLDGRYSLCAKAAAMAARKGILVVNSAGNEADKASWETIITPSDHDSVLCIGGISPSTDYHISFSSLGPSADKRLKPNVSAYGHVVTAGKEGLSWADGTSFSCPLTSGFAACAWQTNPEMTNMELFRKIEQSGHLYPYFDYAHGYGVPQASYFLPSNPKPLNKTFEFSENKARGILHVKVFPAVVNDSSTVIGQNLLYWHIQKADGVLKEYHVVRVDDITAVEIDQSEYNSDDVIRVYFRGYVNSLKLSPKNPIR